MRISYWSANVCSSDLSYDGARLGIVADRAAGALDGTQVRAMVLVHRGRNGDGEEGAVAQALGIGGDLEPRGFQLVLGDLAGRVIARREAFDAALVHVEADDVIEILGEGDGSTGERR